MDLIERLQLASPMLHAPEFHVKREGIYWTIFDGDAPIALVVRDIGTGGAMLDVLKFDPLAAGRPATPPPYAYHYSTRLGYGASFNWSVDSMFQSPDVDTLELLEEHADHLVFLHAGEYRDGSKIACRLEIGYDATIGQYRYDLCWDIDSTRSVVGEFSNIFHSKLMHTEMDVREYDYGCFVRKGGSWEKYPITIMVTVLQHARLQGIALEQGGGAGHINRNGVVPMIVHRKANVPLFAGSCDSCFDLHQTAHVQAGERAHIESRFVDMGRLVAAHPEELRLIDFDDHEAYAFCPEVVCDFTQTLRSAQPWAGAIWKAEHGSSISEEAAHSGARSLKLEATVDAPAMICPYGPALAFDNHTDYEVSAWVKVAGDDTVKAEIELNAFLFTASNPQGLATTVLKGPHGWTKLFARVNSAIADNGYLTLKVSGNGQAWFDEILVRKVQ